MKIKEVADLVGISVRTLHHYHEIDLLIPERMTESGYRIYSDQNLETLQQILFFKELGFPLNKIKEIIHSPSFNQLDALDMQHKMLLEKRERLNKMIDTIERTIQHTKGEIAMSNEEKFSGFDFSNNPYEEEAKQRWGDQAVDQANKKAKELTEFEQDKFNQIYHDLAAVRHFAPDSKVAQEKINAWYVYLNKLGNYSYEAFKNLGQMYIDDKRFTENIDQFGEGLAMFMRDAMAIYADSHQ